LKSEIGLTNRRLRPPQFGLRSLLALVALCGILLALARWGMSPIAIAAVIFLAASIFCHVAGNAIGTRLREMGDQPHEAGAEPGATRRKPQPHEFAPATRLGQRQSLGWTIIVASSVGLASGAIGGGVWTFVGSHGHADVFSIAVGVVAFAVLGGMAAFATAGFTQVLCGAIGQALKGCDREAGKGP
jgi:hypothetical protein